MKNFICTITQQFPDSWSRLVYKNPCENPVLKCSEPINSPVFALIRNTVKKGEKISITVVRPDHENCHTNFNTFLGDLEMIKDEMKFEYELIVVDTPFSERIEDHLDLFEKLLDTVHDDDEIYADITYGTKPIPIVLYMVLTYAYRFRSCFVENTIYGKVNFKKDTGEHLGELYDVTALFYMNSTINTMSDSSDPKKFIKAVLDL